MLTSSLVFNRSETLMGLLLPFIRINKLNVIQLRASNDGFLLFCLESLPCFEIVKIFLHHDITSSYSSRVVLRSDKYRFLDIGADWIGSSVDKSKDVARIEIPKTNCLIFELDSITQSIHELSLKFECHI